MVTNGCENKSFMQPIRRLSIHLGWVQFLGIIFLFFSQCVPMWFTWGSPSSHIVPHYFPNSTSDLSPMVCPLLNSYVYKLKPWAIWEHICFYFATKGSKRCFYWWVPNVPKKKLMMGPNNYGSFETPKKKKLWVAPMN